MICEFNSAAGQFFPLHVVFEVCPAEPETGVEERAEILKAEWLGRNVLGRLSPSEIARLEMEAWEESQL